MLTITIGILLLTVYLCFLIFALYYLCFIK